MWLWLSQYPNSCRVCLFRLLDYVIYFSEKKTIETLQYLNQSILEKLSEDGIELDKVIYVAIDAAGSSSHVMLNLLRDVENLERKGAKLVGSGETDKITKITSEIESGAIIYIDDFSGSGKQFRRNRNWAAQFIVGAFSEFFIAPVICEEACQRIDGTGVVPVTSLIHKKEQRPLHRDTELLPLHSKNSIVEICKEIHPIAGLGFEKMATMAVFYRNAPNSMPLVFRGSLRQTPYKGIFPRSDDLPY